MDYATEMANLKARVENADTVEDSALALIAGLKAQVDALPTPPSAQDIADLSAALDLHSGPLAAAVVTNTPAATA